MKKIISHKTKQLKIRSVIKKSKRHMLVVRKSNLHIYAQIVDPSHPKGDLVLVAASSTEKAIREQKGKCNKTEMAAAVGKLLAERAKDKNITTVGMNRGTHPYHGHLVAFADAARNEGLIF